MRKVPKNRKASRRQRKSIPQYVKEKDALDTEGLMRQGRSQERKKVRRKQSHFPIDL